MFYSDGGENFQISLVGRNLSGNVYIHLLGNAIVDTRILSNNMKYSISNFTCNSENDHIRWPLNWSDITMTRYQTGHYNVLPTFTKVQHPERFPLNICKLFQKSATAVHSQNNTNHPISSNSNFVRPHKQLKASSEVVRSYKTNGTSYNVDKVWSRAPDGRFGK